MKISQRIALAWIRTKFKLLSAISKKKAAAAAFELFCTPQQRVQRKLPPVFEKAESLEVTVEGLKVKGWRWNHPAERKVLILHGFESAVLNFDRYIQPLIQKGYEVLAFDAPAHGRSEGTQINAPLYRAMIRAVDQQFGPIKSFLAHSFGGLAVSLALEQTSTAIDTFFAFLHLPEKLRRPFDLLIVKKAA